MVAHSGATVRADRLRPLNAPRLITAEVDERGRPGSVMRSAELGIQKASCHRWSSLPGAG